MAFFLQQCFGSVVLGDSMIIKSAWVYLHSHKLAISILRSSVEHEELRLPEQWFGAWLLGHMQPLWSAGLHEGAFTQTSLLSSFFAEQH